MARRKHPIAAIAPAPSVTIAWIPGRSRYSHASISETPNGPIRMPTWRSRAAVEPGISSSSVGSVDRYLDGISDARNQKRDHDERRAGDSELDGAPAISGARRM